MTTTTMEGGMVSHLALYLFTTCRTLTMVNAMYIVPHSLLFRFTQCHSLLPFTPTIAVDQYDKQTRMT